MLEKVTGRRCGLHYFFRTNRIGAKGVLDKSAGESNVQTMKWNWSIFIVCIVLILLSPFLFRKHLVPLVAGGKTVAVAKRPLVAFLNGDQEVGVYTGQTKLFALWTDAFHGPVFIHPFSDGQRFLCDYNDDVGMLTFVVDLGSTNASSTGSTNWPSNDDVRKYISDRMTNVVLIHKGVVRLPSLPELAEATSNVLAMSTAQFKSTSFPWCDLGLLKSYAEKAELCRTGPPTVNTFGETRMD